MTFWPTQSRKEEHEVHLKLVLESLRKEKLYTKFSKSSCRNDIATYLLANSGDLFKRLKAPELLMSQRLRLREELNSVHDTFHVSYLKKCLACMTNLHVPLDEIKVDKTFCFVEEPVEIMDREIKKFRKITLVKVRWNSKRCPEFTWEHEDQMRIKYLDKERFQEGLLVFVFLEGAECILLGLPGLATALEELPAAIIMAYDNVIQKKAFSSLILCLGDRVLREIIKETTAEGI
ncbi:hypothetical protein Tco_0255553 [Tanacetum coccineum]